MGRRLPRGYYCTGCGALHGALPEGAVTCRSCGALGLRAYHRKLPRRFGCIVPGCSWTGWDDGVNDDLRDHWRVHERVGEKGNAEAAQLRSRLSALEEENARLREDVRALGEAALAVLRRIRCSGLNGGLQISIALEDALSRPGVPEILEEKP